MANLSELFGDDDDDDSYVIKEEPFDDSIVDEERYESQDQHLFEDTSTNGEYEDVPSTSRSNEKRSPRIAARHYNQASGKRSHATRQQIAILSAFMEKNPEVAKSYNPATICGGITQRQQWEQLARSLNSNGPPMKSITEWKRVWTLRKYSTKKKLTHNKNSIKKSGGRPLNLKPLDETDVAIVNACGMAASVSGIVGALTFGSGSKENKEHQYPAPEQIVEEMPETPETVSESILHETSTTKRASQRKEKEEDILSKQLALQEHFFLSQIQSSKKTNETLGEIRDAIRELCQARIKEVEAANCLKKEELDVRRMELEVAKVANDIKLKEINSRFR